MNHSGEPETAPKAYLNYIVFDRNFNPLIGESGFIRITTASKEDGTNVPHDLLKPDQPLVIKQAGYVYIYLSNENETPVEVFFDDFKVEHIKSPVVQMDDYYPFGLTFNSYQRENSVDQRWKFQGQEHIDDLGLNWDSFKWRNHQPDIGRFFNIDPLADKFYYNSPYAFSENKVTNHVELEGLEALPAQQALNREIKKVENVVMSGVNTVKEGVGKAINWVVGVANFTDNLPRERSSQQSGAGVDIFDTKAGADNKYAPLPDPNGKNMMVDKAVVDAMGAVTEATKPPSPTDLGEKVQVVAEAVDKGAGAGQAAKEVINMDNVVTETGQVTSIPVNKVNDTTEHKNFTFYNVTTQSGKDSVIQTTNEEKKKKQ